jgi:putative toxin-antitoxin system antitoxin component (TIGR02293 family)
MDDLQSLIDAVFHKLGGRRTFDREISSDADLADAVVSGIPLDALHSVRQAGFSEREIERFVIPSRTRRHREGRREPLTIDESDRLVRLARIQALAEDVFGDAEKANKWLRQELGLLNGQAPLELARTEPGARIVEEILGKIAWGAAA